MAETWSVPGYPAMDEAARERARMMQQLLLEKGVTQRVAPPPAPVAVVDNGPSRMDELVANQARLKNVMPKPPAQQAPRPVVAPVQAPVQVPVRAPVQAQAQMPYVMPPSQSPAGRERLPSLSPAQQTLIAGAPRVPTDVPNGPAEMVAQGVRPPAPPAQPVVANVPSPENYPAEQPVQAAAQQAPLEGPEFEKYGTYAPLVKKAATNAAAEPEGFMAKTKSWLDRVGEVFSIKTEGKDPNAIDPAYGVPNAMVWQAQKSALFNAGMLLFAAGMPNSPQNRAQILAQMGNTLSSVGTDIYNAAQSRLMMAKAEGKGKGDFEYGQPYQDASGRWVQQRNDGKVVTWGSTGPEQVAYTKMAEQWVAGDGKAMSIERANGTAESVRMADEMLTLLDEGVIQGATGAAREQLGNMAVQVGMADADLNDRVVRSQVLKAYVTMQVLPMMQALGGSDSNEELRTLMSAVYRQDFTAEASREIFSNMAEKQRRSYGQMVEYRNSIPESALPKGVLSIKPLPEAKVEYSSTGKRGSKGTPVPDKQETPAKEASGGKKPADWTDEEWNELKPAEKAKFK